MERRLEGISGGLQIPPILEAAKAKAFQGRSIAEKSFQMPWGGRGW
jgi:hypothetical protein